MKRLAMLLPISAGILFGCVGLIVRSLRAVGMNNISIIFIRMIFATIMLLAFILLKDRSLLRVHRGAARWVVACAVFGMFINCVSFNVSSTELSLSFAAVMLCMAPVYTVFISRALFGESITAKKLLCMAVAVLGCIFVSGAVGTAVSFSTLGIFCGVISGITYGLIGIFSKGAILRGTNSLTVTFYCLVIITILSAPFADYATIAAYMCGGPANICMLLAQALFIAVLPYVFLTTAAKYLEPGMITILASSEPVAAMIVGFIIYREIPTTNMVAGVFMTVAALALLCTKASEA